MTSHKITSIAHSNIALIKYWGKKDEKLNLPAVDSFSITLNELFTRTTVEFDSAFASDSLIINGQSDNSNKAKRVSDFLNLIRQEAQITKKAMVITQNNFPTGSGLASSASGFAALALAASKAAGLNLSQKELSMLARQGSGSAPRSIFGGFVKMNRGNLEDGSDAFAEQVADRDYWDLRLLILLTSSKEKKIGSTEGMNHTAQTSAFYDAWIHSSVDDLKEMEAAIRDKNFEQVGELAEYSALKMHALALSAKPALIYWNAKTLDLILQVKKLRGSGIPCYVTIDAGPQIKILCLPGDLHKIKDYFNNYAGIEQVIATGLGPAAYINGDDN